jgi:hypothetical protein
VRTNSHTSTPNSNDTERSYSYSYVDVYCSSVVIVSRRLYDLGNFPLSGAVRSLPPTGLPALRTAL